MALELLYNYDIWWIAVCLGMFVGGNRALKWMLPQACLVIFGNEERLKQIIENLCFQRQLRMHTLCMSGKWSVE